jgi:hypothetical protein
MVTIHDVLDTSNREKSLTITAKNPYSKVENHVEYFIPYQILMQLQL